jgi:hypothetical protein
MSFSTPEYFGRSRVNLPLPAEYETGMSSRLRGLLVGSATALFIALAVTGCTPRPRGPTTLSVDLPRTDITAVELRKSSCFGTCPAYTVRFTADGRATYAGVAYAPRVGRFAGLADFERVAAWIDSQHPETLDDGYATGGIDSQRVTLIVERGARRKVVTTANESEVPLRLEGMILALEGETERVRWFGVDDLGPYIGSFTNGQITLFVYGGAGQGVRVSTRVNPCGTDAPFPTTTRAPGALRVRCQHTATTLRPVAEGLRAEGDALAPGLYRRISQREADRRAGLVPMPAPS